MNALRIHVHIDRLVLRGVPREQRDALVASLQRELVRQLAQPGGHADLHPWHAATLRSNLPTLQAGATPAQIGTSAARAIVKVVRS